MPRRLLALLVAGAALAGCGPAQTDRPDLPARVVLDGPPAAAHVGLYVAAVRGYDEAEGVHLRLAPARDDASGVRSLARGLPSFAVLDLHALARAREGRGAGAGGRALDLVAVMALVQKPVPALARRALGRPVDLRGAPRYPELVLAATRATLTTEPALVRATVAAVARGYDEELSDPETAADVMRSRVQGLARAPLLAALTRVDDAFTGPDGRVGTFDRAALAAWAPWEARAGITRRPPDVARAFATPLP